MTSNISSISLSREFCLNNRTYNILDKIRDRYIKRKNRDKDRVL